MTDIQTLYQSAAKFAAEKHANQLVPGSTANYMLHLSNVAMEVMQAFAHEPNFDLAIGVQTALLHDVLEDTDTSYDEIVQNFGKEVADNVQALTKDKSIPDKTERMKDSLKRMKACSKEAAIVKLCDRITNLQKPPKTWPKEKVEKYGKEAQLIQKELNGYNNYLEKRLGKKINEYSTGPSLK